MAVRSDVVEGPNSKLGSQSGPSSSSLSSGPAPRLPSLRAHTLSTHSSMDYSASKIENGTVHTHSSRAPSPRGWLKGLRHLNFYRIHLLVFTFAPLVFSGFVYAANGEFPISYIDCLFLCVTSMTVTGLSTVDLSQLTATQQALVYSLTVAGSLVGVSWLMVYIRLHFFKQKLQHIVESEVASGTTTPASSIHGRLAQMGLLRGLARRMDNKPKLSTLTERTERSSGDEVSMIPGKPIIRRVDEAPRLINPQGWISDDPPAEHGPTDADTNVNAKLQEDILVDSPKAVPVELTVGEREGENEGEAPDPDVASQYSDVPSTNEHPLRRRFGHDNDTQLRHFATMTSVRRESLFPRTQTIEFAPAPRKVGQGPLSHARHGSYSEAGAPSFPRTHTRESRIATSSVGRASAPAVQPARDIGFGGFPGPHELLARLFRKAFPRLERKLTRTLTVPHTTTVRSTRSATSAARPVLEQYATRQATYLSFDATVGRNSAFEMLTSEQQEELGGVEYRALKLLLWVIGIYHVGTQFIACIIIAPYVSQPRWKYVFQPPEQHRSINPVWFTVFQVASAYTNAGTSLVDQSMVPFQSAYPMIVVMGFLILAGNTAFPIFLRFIIWILFKFTSRHSKHSDTLGFLLDHPRRCFVYLFPSHQTWFLLLVLVLLNGTDWFFFLVLDIGNPEIEHVPLGTRFVIGLLQAFAVRAAGFATISLSALAPAVKVLYVTMMYISVYPIALSVRTTNVYEEQSLGIYEPEESSSEEPGNDSTGGRNVVWGQYLAWHARKQLAFDMWWLGLALFLICIVERTEIQNPGNESWFNIFSIVFELVSAYGTVGLSLGTPDANYSFSGALRPLSKLIICIVMIRGRHRGLPVAIDRAVLLPSEFKKQDPEPLEVDDYVVDGYSVNTGTGTGHGHGHGRRRSVSAARKSTV